MTASEDNIDLKNRLATMLTKAEAVKKKAGAPVTTSISLREALRGGFDLEFEETARAGRKPVLVLISGSFEKDGRVQVWGLPAKKLNPSHDFRQDSMGPTPLFRNKKRSGN
jgi:hypothetical protein